MKTKIAGLIGRIRFLSRSVQEFNGKLSCEEGIRIAFVGSTFDLLYTLAYQFNYKVEAFQIRYKETGRKVKIMMVLSKRRFMVYLKV